MSRIKTVKDIRTNKTGSIFRSRFGYTLTELMVTVAIVGILASIGVVNFQNFQRKSRQKEAPSLLGNLFGQMTVFQSEWGEYWGYWRDINFAPSGIQNYNVGFTGVGSPVTDPDFTSNAIGMTAYNTPGACTMAGAMGMGMGMGMGMVADIPNCIDPGVPALTVGGSWNTNMSFLAGAEGVIGGMVNDQWTINQVKALINVQNGTF